MTSSRGANIPSESTRSFSKHMHVVDPLTPTSLPSHTRFTSHLLHAGGLSSLCSHTFRLYVSCSRAARCARLSGRRACIAVAVNSWHAGLPFFLPAEPLVVNEWQQGSTGHALFRCNVWTLGHSRTSWILGTQTGSVWVDGWAWFWKAPCLSVATWWMTIYNLRYSLLQGLLERPLAYSTLCLWRCKVIQVTFSRGII